MCAYLGKEAPKISKTWLFVPAGFILLCSLVILDETMDLPYLLFGAPQTPVNWFEVFIETSIIAIVGFFTVLLLWTTRERRRAEERAEHLNRVLRAVRNVNQLITREKDRQRLIEGACKSLAETRGYFNAWIALLDDSGHLVTHAESGLGEAFAPMVELLKRSRIPACGQEALAHSGVVTVDDPPTACAVSSLSSQYTGHTGMSARLEHAGKVYGILSLSIPSTLADDEQEQELVAEVAADIAFALYAIDVEEARKRGEEALQKNHADLERRVAERTAELSKLNEALRAEIVRREAMQEKLVRAEKLTMMGQLVGGLSHELRNPLGSIKTAAYFLNMVLQDAEPEVKEALQVIEKEVTVSERIITSLLDFAHPKAPAPRLIHVNGVLREALDRAAVPENVEVIQQLDAAAPLVMADPVQICQVFGNIIHNALQAMPQGGRLTIVSEPTEPGTLAVSFSDTGSGISAEHLQHIFDPLFTTKARGIGLGLALSRILIERHGGTIAVESEEGKGSTFTVRLPTGKQEG